MKYLTLIFLLFTQLSMANEVNIDILPSRPQANVPFKVVFKIATSKNADPKINFTPVGIEVINRESRGVSIRTKFINGKLSTEREISYVYEVVSPRPRKVSLRNISVDMGGVKISHKDINIQVYNEAQTPKDFLALAEISKTDVYVGEGITVKYYLLHKSNVRNFDIKKYPKLKKFVKRFLKDQEPQKTVRYEGEVFNKIFLYASRLFADKQGKYIVDPIELRVEYTKRDRNDPFGSFGFGLQRLQARVVRSERTEINVKGLPPVPKGMNFTGLVGEHTFDLKLVRDRYLVNEAIEAKLEVRGGGALELFEPPKIFFNKALEEFEANSDLRILNFDEASKVYEYTYLARSALEIPSRKISLAYFDPIQKSYKNNELTIPKLEVFGGSSTGGFKSAETLGSSNQAINILPDNGTSIVGLNFNPSFIDNLNIFKVINIILGISLLMTLASFFINRKTYDNQKILEANKLLKSLKNGKSDYSTVFQFISLGADLDRDSLTDRLRSMKLSEKSHNYFAKLVDKAEMSNYQSGKENFKFNFEKKHFSEFLKRLRENENYREHS